MSSEQRFQLAITATARRPLAEQLPEAVAFAAHEFINGPLLANPHRVGKRLMARWTIATARAGGPTASSTESTTTPES